MTISADEAKTLLDAASSTVWLGGCNAATGEWDVSACYLDPDHGDSFIGVPLTVKGIGEGHARLIAAAPDLAATVVEQAAEIERLARWKAEAVEVLKGWDQLWDELDRHGQLGDARSAATLEHINTLKTELAEYRRRHRTALEALDADRLATIPKRHIRAILKGR